MATPRKSEINWIGPRSTWEESLHGILSVVAWLMPLAVPQKFLLIVSTYLLGLFVGCIAQSLNEYHRRCDIVVLCAESALWTILVALTSIRPVSDSVIAPSFLLGIAMSCGIATHFLSLHLSWRRSPKDPPLEREEKFG